MITLVQIAREAGCSVSVVSRVLSAKPNVNIRVSEKTRTHIQGIAERLGYKPNRNAEFLKRGSNPVIGVFLPRFADTMLSSLMIGICEEAQQLNFPLSFSFDLTYNGYRQFLQASMDNKNCGIITYPQVFDVEKLDLLLAEFIQKNGNIVFLNRNIHEEQAWSNVPYIDIDHFAVGRLAAERLVARECRSFFCLEYKYRTQRQNGFCHTLEAIGGQRATCLPYRIDIEEDPASLLVLEALIFEKLRSGQGPVGIFAGCDRTAMAVLTRLAALNIRINEDVLLIGCDNQYLGRFAVPSLTTIALPFEAAGHLAIRSLVNLIYDRQAESTKIAPELVIRGTA